MVERTAIPTDKGAIYITLSVGVATLSMGDADFDALLERADLALYAAKDAGRNRVCVAPERALAIYRGHRDRHFATKRRDIPPV